MAIQLVSTATAALGQGLKMLIHAPAGTGKTTLLSTITESQVIISAEAGLLSLRHFDIPAITVQTIDQLEEAYQWLFTEQGQQFKWVSLDSISEIAEVCLASEMKQTKDPRKAYGEMQTKIMETLRKFRDLPGRNVAFISKQERKTDDQEGLTLYQPMMPGNKLGQQIPYLFDEVFALRIFKDDQGSPSRYLQTSRDLQYEAKDRSGALDMWEQPNLQNIAGKIFGSVNAQQQPAT